MAPNSAELTCSYQAGNEGAPSLFFSPRVLSVAATIVERLGGGCFFGNVAWLDGSTDLCRPFPDMFSSPPPLSGAQWYVPRRIGRGGFAAILCMVASGAGVAP